MIKLTKEHLVKFQEKLKEIKELFHIDPFENDLKSHIRELVASGLEQVQSFDIAYAKYKPIHEHYINSLYKKESSLRVAIKEAERQIEVNESVNISLQLIGEFKCI